MFKLGSGLRQNNNTTITFTCQHFHGPRHLHETVPSAWRAVWQWDPL